MPREIIGPRFPRSDDWCELSDPARAWFRTSQWGVLYAIRGEPLGGIFARRDVGKVFHACNLLHNRLSHPKGVRPTGS